MNASQDCILAVLSGQKFRLGYEGVEAFVVSIAQSGFRGHKVMVAWDIYPDTRRLLLEYGWELASLSDGRDYGFFHARMRAAWEFLRYRSTEFRYIFWLDVKDLVVQSDPSLWMEEHLGTYGLVGASEPVTIEQEWTNQCWARDVLGDSGYAEIKDELVLNGGTWAGRSELMTEVFHQVSNRVAGYRGPYPPCQPTINYVLRQPGFREHLFIPRWTKGFAACLHPFWSWDYRDKLQPISQERPPVIDFETRRLHPGLGPLDPENKMIAFGGWMDRGDLTLISASAGPLAGVECVKDPANHPFVIVHGYDRDWRTRRFMEERYQLPIEVAPGDVFHTERVPRSVWRWARSNDLLEIDLGSIALSDLNGRWPFEDSSVGMLVAQDVFHLLRDRLHTMTEVYRVLAPGGWLFCQVPSTEGRGAFQDPRTQSFWSENSFHYYTKADKSRYIDTPVRFQASQLYTTDKDGEGVCWTNARLISLKGGFRPPGLIEI